MCLALGMMDETRCWPGQSVKSQMWDWLADERRKLRRTGEERTWREEPSWNHHGVPDG